MPRDPSDASTWERVGSEAAVGQAPEPGAASDNSSTISQGEHVRFRAVASTRAQHSFFGRGVRPQRGPWSVRLQGAISLGQVAEATAPVGILSESTKGQDATLDGAEGDGSGFHGH
ncbi:uncharacterized protein Triagg1_3820 [Trichoderma aggressivum f. europaeum]|uniref:Uncharacterized protein n=1 Tax=Trichoderma aggressivum f. europaeum TaxID=173218 RepID=A0AAE1M4A5_9HYPO|nr:hypothetical protein Triagg1_3820 [Trichoderma aggressivum f. europaeum]